MDKMQQAHYELERLQGIITRHEGHMFSLRGWLLVVIGGLLTSYYSKGVIMSPLVLAIALLVVVLLFLIVESRHVNLVEAVVERTSAIEKQIRCENQSDACWYDGPRVSDACQDGANRWWPRNGMTFILNRAFYLVVIVIIALTTVYLSLRQRGVSQPATTVQPVQK